MALPLPFAAFALLLVLAFRRLLVRTLRRTVLFALWLSLLFDYGSWASGTASSSTWRVTPSGIYARGNLCARTCLSVRTPAS